MIKFCFAVLSLAALASAASPTGKYVGDTPGMSGALEKTTFDFKSEEGKLTGTVILSSGNSYPIENGTATGDKFKFHITVKMGRDTKMMYTGTMSGTEIKMTREMEGIGRKVEFTAKPAQ